MLQPFAVERGTPRGGSQQKPLAARVGRQPDEVAHPLEPEHRVVDVERDHADAEVGIGCSRRHETRHGSRLVDSLFENLAILRLAVVRELPGVDRFVELAGAGVDAELRKEPFHSEGAGLVGNDRHDVLADRLVFQQRHQGPAKGPGGREFAVAAASQQFLEGVEPGDVELRGGGPSLGETAPQHPAAFLQVGHFLTVGGGAVERGLRHLFVGDGNGEPRAELAQLVFVDALLLVGDVLAFPRLAQAVALDGLGQDHAGGPDMFHRRLVGCVDLLGIVPAAL